MQQGARLSAAIEILQDMTAHHRPVAVALREWGRSHRFAGSADRAAIGNLVYDALRHKSSLAWRMGDDSPRAMIIAALRFVWQASADDIARLCDGSKFAPAPLEENELKALEHGNLDNAPSHVQGDYPEWLQASFARVFADMAVAEGRALAARAPLDIRVNTLKATREKLQKALGYLGAKPTAFSPHGLRIAPPAADLQNPAARLPHIESEAAHGKGWFEVQDEASQLAALLCGAEPGMQLADICAGAGGKTLALAAAMHNKGQIHAWDSDKHRLRPIWERLKRAGVRNVQVLQGGDNTALDGLSARMDIVLADAPCTGSGSWRRKPDAKWRLGKEMLKNRLAEQSAVLASAAKLVKPGGRLVYVTCSLLPEENGDQIKLFCKTNPEFAPLDLAPQWQKISPGTPVPHMSADSETGLLLSPARHNTDGFFIAALRKAT